MDIECKLIDIYMKIDKAYQDVTAGSRIRQRGPDANLTDAEVITIEIFGESNGHHTDIGIWRYARYHWLKWFPRLGSYKAFAKQCANLSHIKHMIMSRLFPPQDTIHITDGVPMSICHYARASRCKIFKGEAAFGYCAAKDENYYGFKGHIVVNIYQQVTGFTITPANTDERDVLHNLRGALKGLLIADKGLISKPLQEELLTDYINLQTPLRDNMKDDRSKSFVKILTKTRRLVETVIGQLVEFYGFASCKSRDIWHLSSKLVRKLLAYNLARS